MRKYNLGALYKGELYRIQDEKGVGPYSAMYNNKLIDLGVKLPKDMPERGPGRRPSPWTDFSEFEGVSREDIEKYKYAFPSIEAVRSWFSELELLYLKMLGLKLYRAVDMSGTALISTSERQVVYEGTPVFEEISWDLVLGAMRTRKLSCRWGFPMFEIPRTIADDFMLKSGQLAIASGPDWAIYDAPKNTIVLTSDAERAYIMDAIKYSSAGPPNYRSVDLIGGAQQLGKNDQKVHMFKMDKIKLLPKDKENLVNKFDPSVRAEDNSMMFCNQSTMEERNECFDLALEYEMLINELVERDVFFTDNVAKKAVYALSGDSLAMVVPGGRI
jgi:hypothetical protein